MIDQGQLTNTMIVLANESAMRALRLAGVPLGVAQKLILSRAWREAQKKNAAEKVKHILRNEKGEL